MDIPRKFSVKDMETSAELHDLGLKMEVLLDGKKQFPCAAYDMDAGTVTNYVFDAEGRLMTDGHDFKSETLTGHVEVRLREDA